jgi:hypothetical protein
LCERERRRIWAAALRVRSGRRRKDTLEHVMSTRQMLQHWILLSLQLSSEATFDLSLI